MRPNGKRSASAAVRMATTLKMQPSDMDATAGLALPMHAALHQIRPLGQACGHALGQSLLLF